MYFGMKKKNLEIMKTQRIENNYFDRFRKLLTEKKGVLLTIFLVFALQVSAKHKHWGPSFGYHHKHHYVYYPKQNFYYDPYLATYIVYENGYWIRQFEPPTLLTRININVLPHVDIEIASFTPQTYNYVHRHRYRLIYLCAPSTAFYVFRMPTRYDYSIRPYDYCYHDHPGRRGRGHAYGHYKHGHDHDIVYYNPNFYHERHYYPKAPRGRTPYYAFNGRPNDYDHYRGNHNQRGPKNDGFNYRPKEKPETNWKNNPGYMKPSRGSRPDVFNSPKSMKNAPGKNQMGAPGRNTGPKKNEQNRGPEKQKAVTPKRSQQQEKPIQSNVEWEKNKRTNQPKNDQRMKNDRPAEQQYRQPEMKREQPQQQEMRRQENRPEPRQQEMRRPEQRQEPRQAQPQGRQEIRNNIPQSRPAPQQRGGGGQQMKQRGGSPKGKGN